VFYIRRPEMETADEKISFLANNTARSLSFDEVQPDKTHNWINLTSNDFDSLLPLASKDTKAAKTAGKERAIFKLYSLGVNTNRDDWVYDLSVDTLKAKISYFIKRYNANLRNPEHDYSIKWSSSLVAHKEAKKACDEFKASKVIDVAYRPFFKVKHYSEKMLNHRLTDNHYQTFGDELQSQNSLICIDPGSSKSFSALATDTMPDLHLNGDTQFVPQFFYRDGVALDNITDWALKQFRQHYEQPSPQPSPARGRGRSAAGGKGKARKITKEAIFHYCYAVLHDPLYREKYALNLKREFPRIPFYADFWQWAAWGEALMKLHIGYEAVEPFKLERTDIPDEKVRAAGLSPKALLRADKDAGSIALDSETTLRGIPPEAWDYKLGNRCALEWVLDQYKEKKPKDPTIREKFDTYRFADYKEKVIDLLARVTTVSVETERITQAMKAAAR